MQREINKQLKITKFSTYSELTLETFGVQIKYYKNFDLKQTFVLKVLKFFNEH